MTEFENTLKNSEFIGIVEDNKDPDKKQRVRIRIPYLHGDANAIPTDAIPWAQPIRDNNGLSFSVPDLNKIVMVTFPTGNQYFPVYRNAVHLNINLQKKIEQYSDTDYTSFVALCYNHNAQIYFDRENFNLFYKLNGLKIGEDEIIIKRKDASTTIKIGNENADQSIVLGDNWMDFFNEFMQVLPTAFLTTSPGSPAAASPDLIKVIGKYNSQKINFLSKKIFAVDNDDTTTNDVELEGKIGDGFDIVTPNGNSSTGSGSTDGNSNLNIITEDLVKPSKEPFILPKTNLYDDKEPTTYIQEATPAPKVETIINTEQSTEEEEEDYSYINDEDYYYNQEEEEEEEDVNYDETEFEFDYEYDEITEDGVSPETITSSTGQTVPVQIGSSEDLFFNYNTLLFNQPKKNKKYPTSYQWYVDPTKIRLKGTVTKQQIIDMKKKLEGGLSRSTKDSAHKDPCPTPFNGKTGWHTNKGITYRVWKSVFGTNNDKRFLNMSDADWQTVFDKVFWYKYQDKTNVDVSALKVFIVWGSGPGGLQKNLKAAETLLGKPFNSVSPEMKIAALLSARYQFFVNISQPGVNNNEYRTGWINAVNKYIKLVIQKK